MLTNDVVSFEELGPGHDDSDVDHFYQQLQETIDQTPKKDILVVQGDWNAKVGKAAQADWGEVCGP